MNIIFGVGPKTKTKELEKLRQYEKHECNNHAIYFLNGIQLKELIERFKNLKNSIINEGLLSICILLNFDDKNYERIFLEFAKEYLHTYDEIGLKCLTIGIQQTKDFIHPQNVLKNYLYESQGYKILREKKKEDLNFFLWKNVSDIKAYFFGNNVDKQETLNKNMKLFYQRINALNEKKYFIITGSTSEEILKGFLFANFRIDYKNSIDTYSSKENQVYINCNMHRLVFNSEDFFEKCDEIRNKLSEIILIENSNPRPETLNNDIVCLRRVFSQDELKSFLRIGFTMYGNVDVQSLKADVIKFDVLFENLGLGAYGEREEFFKNRFFIINK